MAWCLNTLNARKGITTIYQSYRRYPVLVGLNTLNARKGITTLSTRLKPCCGVGKV